MYLLNKVPKSADFTGSISNFDTCSTVFIFVAYTCKGQPKMESSVEGDKSQPSVQKFKNNEESGDWRVYLVKLKGRSLLLVILERK